MAQLEAALVPADAMSTFKQDVTRLIQGAKCRLRSIRPGPVKRRALADVLGVPNVNPKRPVKGPQWEVEQWVTSLSLQGSFGNLLEFLSALDNEARIVHCASLHLRAPPETTDELVLDLDIETFDLFRNRPD